MSWSFFTGRLRTRRSQVFLGLACVFVVAVVVIGAVQLVRDAPQGTLLPLSGSSMGMSESGVSNVHPGQPVSVGDYMLCLSSPGSPAHLVAVTPVGGNGKLEVVGFAVRPDPFKNGGSALGTAFESLPNLGFRPLSHSVDVVCNESGSRFVELGVRLVSPGGISSLQSLSVAYTIDGSQRTLTLSDGIVLCPGAPGGSKCKVSSHP